MFLQIDGETKIMALFNFTQDLVLSIFEYSSNITLDKLFKPKTSFKWDDNYFISNQSLNNNLNIPSLWDPETANLNIDFFQSGHGFSDNLKLKSIDIKQVNNLKKWTPRLKHGSYFTNHVPYYLYSDEAVTENLKEEFLVDGRSRFNLLHRPKDGVPISVQLLELDENFNTDFDSLFVPVTKFTGLAQNGVELDTSAGLNIDTAFKEFILHSNPDSFIKSFKIPSLTGPGLTTFTLLHPPIDSLPVSFSRKDLFVERVYVPPASVGEYYLDLLSGDVDVFIDQSYIDLGTVSYHKDYPAWLEFNNNYIVDYGSTILAPTPLDIPSLVRGPQSNGLPNQIISLDNFPIIDNSTESFLDTSNFHLFVYNPFTQVFDNTWQRVRNFENTLPIDKHYILDPDTGIILFAGVNQGAVPPLYHFFFFGYKTTLKIQYEPEASTDYWTDRARDNHPLHNTLSDGFLFISRKELIPASIVIKFPVEEITSLESAPLFVTVLDRELEPIPNMEVELTITGDIGNLESTTVITDSAGEGVTFYIPSSKITDLGVSAFLYDLGPNVGTPGAPVALSPYSTRNVINDTLTLSGHMASIPEEVILFKIYANVDPFDIFYHNTNKGGRYVVHYEFDGMDNVLIRPISVEDRVLTFADSLPQSYSALDPYYEPDLRGFIGITSKEIFVQGKIKYRDSEIFSNIETLIISYSPIQKGEWTLPILPTTFIGSEIDRAIWITLNP
jgi:hypothetical protein